MTCRSSCLLAVVVALALLQLALSAQVLSSVRIKIRRGPSLSAQAPPVVSSSSQQQPAQQSSLAKSISKALDKGGSSIGIPSVDDIIKSTSTLSSSPTTTSNTKPSHSKPASAASAGHGKHGKHKRKPNKVTVISNLNVMQHNEVPPQKVNLVALSEQNSKTSQEHRRKQADSEARDVRKEEERKHEKTLVEQDTKADIADANSDSAEQNRKAADEANNKYTAVMSSEQSAKSSTQNANEQQVKQKLQQDEQTGKSEASTKMMAQASAEQQSKAEQIAKSNKEGTEKAAAEAKNKADEAAQKKKQADEAAEKKVQEDKEKQKYIINAGPINPTKGFIMKEEADIKLAPQWALMFWINPKTISNEWTSILHHGNTDSDRNPAIFFYPSSFRMHIRSGSAQNWNGGYDTSSSLATGSWTHVSLVHRSDGLSVYLNGAKLGQDNNSGPLQKAGKFYCSNPWYAAAQAQLADIRFFDRFVSDQEVKLVYEANKHPS